MMGRQKSDEVEDIAAIRGQRICGGAIKRLYPLEPIGKRVTCGRRNFKGHGATLSRLVSMCRLLPCRRGAACRAAHAVWNRCRGRFPDPRISVTAAEHEVTPAISAWPVQR